MTGSKRVDHWTSGTVYECSEIPGSPQERFLVCLKKVMFVSVVSILVRNTKTNRKKIVGFMKQTEKEPKQIEFRYVSV
jgi:hypothetical protein